MKLNAVCNRCFGMIIEKFVYCPKLTKQTTLPI